MSRNTNPYHSTIYACFTGFIVQAIVNNFAPLLFLTFQKTYHITLDRIALLITVNFGTQLIVDFLSSKCIDRVGYRAGIVAAHVFAAGGLLSLAVLPELLPDAYAGIVISVILYAVGGGLIEVLVSPIVEACPTERKEAAMSLLHSFYCWGQLGVVVLSTCFFSGVGIRFWKVLCVFWALIPAVNAIVFTRVPIHSLTEDGSSLPIRALAREKTFWLLLVLMLCAGACELSVSQWASAFAESALGVSKTVGDLAGPAAFAFLMGTARAFYAKASAHIPLHRFMVFSGALCVASYLLIALSPLPILSLLGCALCGLSVGILWPGTFSIAARQIPAGGTALFALLALGGDLGCGSGPTLVGFVSSLFGDHLKTGILSASIFPIVLLAALHFTKAHSE